MSLTMEYLCSVLTHSEHVYVPIDLIIFPQKNASLIELTELEFAKKYLGYQNVQLYHILCQM